MTRKELISALEEREQWFYKQAEEFRFQGYEMNEQSCIGQGNGIADAIALIQEIWREDNE